MSADKYCPGAKPIKIGELRRKIFGRTLSSELKPPQNIKCRSKYMHGFKGRNLSCDYLIVSFF